MLHGRGSGYQEGGAAPRCAEQHILTLGEIGATVVYSYCVLSVRGPTFIPPQPPLHSLPLAVDLQLTPSYQQSLQIKCNCFDENAQRAGRMLGGGKSICTCGSETQISTHLALLHLGCPRAEDLNLPTSPYAGKENLPKSQAWSDA